MSVRTSFIQGLVGSYCVIRADPPTHVRKGRGSEHDLALGLLELWKRSMNDTVCSEHVDLDGLEPVLRAAFADTCDETKYDSYYGEK